MFKALKSFSIISRSEFLLPNLGSLIMGLAWGARPATSLSELATAIILSFTIINLSSAIGAQVNTLSDRELDSKDIRKKPLVEATDSFSVSRLKKVLIAELAITFALVLVFAYVQQRLFLLPLWIVGISLGCAYSLPPPRLKKRSWLAPASLILVLAFFPVLFAYYSFTVELNPLFLMSLTGLGLTVYAVIVPTEIRDYFGDQAMGTETFTVHIGLVKASVLGILLLATGAGLTTTAFILQFIQSQHILLSIMVILIPIAALVVLRQFAKLYSLAKEYAASDSSSGSVEERIVSLAADNPKWIMIITQTYTLISIILLVSKYLL